MRATLTLLLCLCSAALTECQRRRIEKLPGLNFQPNFQQYSGYLTSTSGRRLFYWLVESSQVAPADAPLVLWLNGGPGCSSVGGLLMTNGPFLANDRAQLDRNEMAWNRVANMLYIDSPNGVGLSEPGPTDKSVLNDNYTTELNLKALFHFFNLFPEFRGRPFYMTGESYAGIYIPLLAHAIMRSGKFPHEMNLKGIAVGNGLHVAYKELQLSELQKEMSELMGISLGRIDVSGVSMDHRNYGINPYNIAKYCHKNDNLNTYPCLNSTGLSTYLNNMEVRRALGIDEAISGTYEICQSFRIGEHYIRAKRDVLPELLALTKASVSVLLYHGTLDYLIPVKVTQMLIDKLQRKSIDTKGTWFYCYKDSTGTETLQIGGLEKSYIEGDLKYRTVIGAGHSVPTDRPDMGFQIFTDFLQQRSRHQRPNCQGNMASRLECERSWLVTLTLLVFSLLLRADCRIFHQ